MAHRPATNSIHKLHFKTYLKFLNFYHLPLDFSLQNILWFLQFLKDNSLAPKVIQGYVSSLRAMCSLYALEHSALQHYRVHLMLRSIRINTNFQPRQKGVFDLNLMEKISSACNMTGDPKLFRAAFLMAFFGFLRMSNIAPHSAVAYTPERHILRQDIVFKQPGTHVVIKWAKTLQDKSKIHIIQLPSLQNRQLCPTLAIYNLLQDRILPPDSPLFAAREHPHKQVIDTHFRDALKMILTHLGESQPGLGFHAFRRSGATFAFDHKVPLQAIMNHGMWKSSAV